MSKHSPGPWHWEIDKKKTHGCDWPSDANRKWVFWTEEPAWLKVSDEDKRLIASAPEMLELLRELEAEPNATAWKDEIRALLKRIDG